MVPGFLYFGEGGKENGEGVGNKAPKAPSDGTSACMLLMAIDVVSCHAMQIMQSISIF